MNPFKLFGLKRKSAILYPIEGFFELHSRATEGKKRQKEGAKGRFFSQLKKFKWVQ
tara:strand:+ start:181 stop:348 length:168 start_codon:yes stop_codon:yes gene_type:complete